MISKWSVAVILLSAIVVIGILIRDVDGQTGCSFPSDIRGNWTSSRKGVVEFNETHISGRIVCAETVCSGEAYESWTCVQNDGEKYLVRSAPYEDFGNFNYLYICLYLYKVTSTKYVYYHGPKDKNVFFDDYATVQSDSTIPAIESICNLDSPLSTDRYHLFVKEDFVTSSFSYCPNDLLGNFVSSDPSSCNATVEVCGDQNSIQVTNSSINPNLFLSVNGSLKCMYSLSDDSQSITYLTLYNQDDTFSVGETGFVCVAIFKSGEQVSLTQQTGDCIGLKSPNATTPICTFNSTLYCPITCEFSSSLVGSWVSTRKGDIAISGDTMTGFEPKGIECNTTTCNNAPTTFQCYMKTSNTYLIRSSATSINSVAVRIYVCLKFSQESSSKYIYYHDHANTHDTLEEYLITLNAATPVDSMSEVCEGLSSDDPALYTVFIKSDSLSANVISCPSDLEKIYNVSNSHCEYTLGTCDDPSEIKLSSTACSPSPFYTENGTMGCVYSTTSGDTRYLTLYNRDETFTNGTTYMFTCMAYTVSGSTNLQFSQTPYGCHKSQSPTNVTTDEGLTFEFDSIGSCPTSDEFPWIYIVIGLAALLALIVLIVIIWCCCCRRKRAAKKGDEEKITDDVSEESKSSIDNEEESPKKRPLKKLMDVFTVGKNKKARVRELEKSKLKHRKGQGGDEESFDSGVTGVDECEVAGKSHKRKRKRRRRKRRKRMREDGTEEYVSTDDDDYEDDEYDDEGSCSDYSDSFESDESYTDSEGLGGSHKKGHLEKSTKSKAHQLHIAKAWEKRQNNPSLVRSTGSPSKGREDGETRVEGEYNPDMDLLPGEIVPIASVLSKGSPFRGRDKQSSRMSSARTNLRYIPSPTRQKPSVDDRIEEARERYFNNIPHLELYIDYKEQREQMEGEGFWDDLEEKKTADALFNFKELDEKLVKIEAGDTEDGLANDSTEKTSIPGTMSRPSTTIRRDQDPTSIGTQSTAPVEDINQARPTSAQNNTTLPSAFLGASDTDKESTKTDNKEKETNSDEEFESNIVTESDSECPIDIQSPAPREKVTFVGSANLMARFYSRLNQIRNSKADINAETPPEAPATDKTDKRRVRTALRRMLTERLFPELRPVTPVKPLTVNGDNDLTISGATTPFTLDTKSKTSLSQQSKDGTAVDRDNFNSISGSKGRVLFVESSDLSGSTDISTNSNISKQTTLGYYRRHEGPVSRPDNISKLYQPSRSKTSLSMSTRDSILKDPEFIKSLKSQIGKFNDRTNPTTSTGPPNRPIVSWAYNNQPRPRDKASVAGGRSPHSNQGMSRAELEDWQLKKLLEELYQDKKYMDTLISTKGDNSTEEDISKSLKAGREYLLQRAAYWLEKGPLPPRPPTSELGFRLERQQSVMSARSVKTT